MALSGVQVNIMTEAGERDLVITGNVETKPAETQITPRLSPAIQKYPTLSLLDLVSDLIRPHVDLESSETLLVTFVWNFDLVPLHTASDYGR